MAMIEALEEPIGKYILRCINENDESLFEPIYLILKDRREKTKKNLEKIVRLFLSENKYECTILKKRSEYKALLIEEKLENNMQYDIEVDMRYHPVNYNNIVSIISRVKTYQSIFDKIIKKKIFGITQHFEQEKPRFLKFGVYIVCLPPEAKKLRDNMTSKEYATLKSRIRTDATIKPTYQGYLEPLIIKTENSEMKLVAKGVEVKTIKINDSIEKIVDEYIKEQKMKKLESELCIADLGGINFVLNQNFGSKEFEDIAERIISKIHKNGFKVSGQERKEEKSGYKALHYNLKQPNVVEGIEVRITNKKDLINNEFGTAYAERYKQGLEKIKIPSDKEGIVSNLYKYIKEKEKKEKNSILK
ncbi:MAG: hypothetical protein QW199_03225 [Candidatus Pacearchaeota archaeon]